MLTCNDCIHCEVCVRQKIYGEYSITECKGHFLGKADVQEVVRCKDCKHLLEEKMICLHSGNQVFHTGKPTFHNHFCSYGVKRSEDNG